MQLNGRTCKPAKEAAPLFEKHFGFSAIPFRKDIPPLALFPSRAHQELVARLVQAVPRAEIMCVTGDTGAGKSTALRAAQHTLNSALYRFIYVPNPNMAARDLYQELLRELGVQPPWSTTNARRQLRESFQALREDGRTPVVILDEAQKIPPGLFDELRILTNFNLDSTPVFSLILAGHPDLSRLLARRGNEALTQRIGFRFHLTGMDWDETKAYVTHQLALAGVTRPIFTEDALRLLFQNTQGIPRRVNSAALKALEVAYLQQHELVNLDTLEMSSADAS